MNPSRQPAATSSRSTRIIKGLTGRARLGHLLLLAFLLLTPALTNSFFGDDFYHYAQLNGKAGFMEQDDDLSLFNLFSFTGPSSEKRKALQSLSIIPWWAGAQFSWKFWRPVTELTLYVDYVWLKYPPLMHLHSILWFLALVTLAHTLFVQLFANRDQALLATALFAVDGSHGMMVGWLCSRSALLACCFGLLTLLSHHHAIRRQRTGLHLVALATLALALLSAEIGISTCAWLFAYAMFIDQRSLARRISSLFPYALVVAIWWIIYKHAGFGVSGSNDFYIEPLSKPLQFLQQLAGHIPVLLATLWLAVPSDLFGVSGIARAAAIICGLAGAALLLLLYRHQGQQRLLLFFSCGSILAIFPLASTALQDRNIVFVTLGFSAIIALAMITLWEQLQNQGKRLQRVALLLLIIIHLGLSPLLLLGSSRLPTLFAQPALQRAATLEYSGPAHIMVIHAPAAEMAYLAPSLLHLHAAMPASIWNLAGTQSDFTLAIVDDHTLRLTSTTGLVSRSEQFVRNISTEPFRAGDEVRLAGLTIDIVRANDAGHPVEVLFHSAIPLHEFAIWQWHKKGFTPLTLADFPVTYRPRSDPNQQ